MQDCLAIDYQKDGDSDIILFVKLKEDYDFESIRAVVRKQIKSLLSPRHIPKYMLEVKEIPYTRSGKKTEVAVRAIFKAITSGKQVILLAPTTILAQQHWKTLTNRFSPYPIKVSLLKLDHPIIKSTFFKLIRFEAFFAKNLHKKFS